MRTCHAAFMTHARCGQHPDKGSGLSYGGASWNACAAKEAHEVVHEGDSALPEPADGARLVAPRDALREGVTQAEQERGIAEGVVLFLPKQRACEGGPQAVRERGEGTRGAAAAPAGSGCRQGQRIHRGGRHSSMQGFARIVQQLVGLRIDQHAVFVVGRCVARFDRGLDCRGGGSPHKQRQRLAHLQGPGNDAAMLAHAKTTCPAIVSPLHELQ